MSKEVSWLAGCLVSKDGEASRVTHTGRQAGGLGQNFAFCYYTQGRREESRVSQLPSLLHATVLLLCSY